MIDKDKIKAVAFDFGGTLDSPFLHWMDIYIHLYTMKLNLPLTKENFRDSYVYAERMMEQLQLVKPEHSLLETQAFKTDLQFKSLIERGVLPDTLENRKGLPLKAARLVTDYSSDYVVASRTVLDELHRSYTLLLVSNYYGNLKKIVTDLGIVSYFHSITDSTLEGVRKPDPSLWKRAIDHAGFAYEEVLVVGDSMKNDIQPGLSLGCQVVQGCPEGRTGEVGIPFITRLSELPALLSI